MKKINLLKILKLEKKNFFFNTILCLNKLIKHFLKHPLFLFLISPFHSKYCCNLKVLSYRLSIYNITLLLKITDFIFIANKTR
jgi:hypothetical protein